MRKFVPEKHAQIPDSHGVRRLASERMALDVFETILGLSSWELPSSRGDVLEGKK